MGGVSHVDICMRRALSEEETETEKVLNGERGLGNIKGTVIKFHIHLK